MGFFGFKQKGRLGVDIGTSSIKIVELLKESNRLKLNNYGLFELESVEGAVNSNHLAKAAPAHLTDQDLIWAVKETIKRAKISVKDTIASIPSFSTFSTVITMPYLSEKDIAQSIPFEARKYIPIPMSEVVLDWSIINIANGEKQMPPSADQKPTPRAKPPTVEIFLVAVPKEETMRYQKIMREAGLNLKALELENSALIRSLVGNDLSPTAIINIGGRSTSILIVDGGVERLSHNYEVGGFEITRSISKSLGVSLRRAEEMKRKTGVAKSDNDAIRQATSALLDMMAFETKKTIHGYEEVNKTKISRTILVGGLVNMPSLAEYFSEKLGFPVDKGSPTARVMVPPELDKIRNEINSTFAIAVGLAMREI